MFKNDGELFKADQKKFKETIVFVPFFFGKKQQLKKHVLFVNSLGFDAFAFTLTDDFKKLLPRLPSNISNGWGIKHLWTKEITSLLDSIKGQKIIYAFSNPSSAAIEAVAKRGSKDISAFICDGGPFYNLIKCNWNYFTHENPISNLPKKIFLNTFARLTWTIQHEEELFRDLSSFPKNFPILSIRGWKDPLVPPHYIEKVFSPHKQLDLEVLNLPEGGHLDGLKNFEELYQSRVQKFLEVYGTLLR